MAKQLKKKIDQTTEEKIKIAARKLFTRKGFAAVKTRDIAEEAGSIWHCLIITSGAKKNCSN